MQVEKSATLNLATNRKSIVQTMTVRTPMKRTRKHPRLWPCQNHAKSLWVFDTFYYQFQCSYIQFSATLWFSVFSLYILTLRELPVTRCCIQGPGAPAPNWLILNPTSRPVHRTCVPATTVQMTFVSAARFPSSLDSVPMLVDILPTGGHLNSAVILFCLYLDGERSWFKPGTRALNKNLT